MLPWVSIGGSVDLIREISGDVTAAAAALAGLLLVFLGGSPGRYFNAWATNAPFGSLTHDTKKGALWRLFQFCHKVR
jgi:hypothetical protein